MKKIIVPALTGKFGEWRYYQIIFQVKDLVENLGTTQSPSYRVKAVEEVEEIYSEKGVSKLLQRAYDPNRLEPIKNYILKQPDKYLNNLTIGIFGGSPDWFPINVSDNFETESEELKEIEQRIGFIELTGAETLFVLDGQHRLKGLRKAFEENPKKVSDEEIVCTLIVHHPDKNGRIRTRRLFSTINRQAKPVSKGENILLDEDDVSAILVRSLVEEYKRFKDKEVIALIKGGNITIGQYDKFSTVVTLYEINEKLILKDELYPKGDDKKYVRVRPTEELIVKAKKRVFRYWDTFFNIFPKTQGFLNTEKSKRAEFRTKSKYFTLRPITQLAIFEIILTCEKDSPKLLEKLKKLPMNEDDKFWHHTLWNPFKNGVLYNRSLIRNYIKYNIGLSLKPKELERLKDGYRKNSGDLELELDKPKFI